MKKSILIGTAVLTAAFCAAALTGCDSSKFNVSNYAGELNDSGYAAGTSHYTTATTIEGTVDTSSLRDSLVRVKRSDNKYSVYDLDKKEFLHDGLVADSIVFTNFPFILLANDVDSQRLYSVMTPNGQLVSFGSGETFETEPVFATQSYLVNSVQKTVYTVTCANQRRYFAYSDARGNKHGKEFRELGEGEIYGLLTENTTFSNIPHYAVYNDETSYDGYTYSRTFVSASGATGSGLGMPLGTTAYTFFKDNAEIGSCTFSNGDSFFLGNYLYYYEMTSVDSDAKKGYNLVLESTTSLKFNVTYYRYDFKKNKTKKINTDYIYIDFEALYNKTAKDYDCAVAKGYKKENGVAVVGAATSISTVLVGKNLKTQKDYTGEEFLPWEATKIADGRYLVAGESSGYYLFDNDLKTLAVYSSLPTVYADANMITTSNAGYYYATDTNGKIVMRNLYGAYVFYGDTAILTINGVKTCVNKDNSQITFEQQFGENAIEKDGLVRITTTQIKICNYENREITTLPLGTLSQTPLGNRQLIAYSESGAVKSVIVE